MQKTDIYRETPESPTTLSFESGSSSLPTGLMEVPKMTEIPQASDDSFKVKGKYLWRGEKQIFDLPLSTLNDGYDEPDLDYGVAFAADDRSKTRLTFWIGGGCEGCSRLLKKYIDMDKETGSISIGEYGGAGLSALFQRGAAELALPSPDEAKIAFVTGWMDDDEEPERIWVFDLMTGLEEKMATVKAGYSVFDDTAIPYIEETKLHWSETSHKPILNVPTYVEPHTNNKEFSLGFGPDVHAIDFDGDGRDEYVVYQEKRLPKPIMFNFSEIEDNGTYKIFRWGEVGWEKIFEDEDTVGKKGYAVFSRLDRERFFKIVDADKDGAPEAQISFDLEGTGGYSKSYTLEWDGTKLIKKDITSE